MPRHTRRISKCSFTPLLSHFICIIHSYVLHVYSLCYKHVSLLWEFVLFVINLLFIFHWFCSFLYKYYFRCYLHLIFVFSIIGQMMSLDIVSDILCKGIIIAWEKKGNWISKRKYRMKWIIQITSMRTLRRRNYNKTMKIDSKRQKYEMKYDIDK